MGIRFDYRCILCFIIQRDDVNEFTTSIIDPIYKDAVRQACENGVEINTLQVKWNRHGECCFVTNDLNISL